MDELQTPISGSGVTPQPPIIPTAPAKSFLGLVVKIVAGVVVVAVVGVGTLLVTRIWDPLWNPFRPNPEKVIEEMFAKMKEVKTLRSEINGQLSIKNEQSNEELKLSFGLQADGDITDYKNPKSDAVFNINIAMPASLKKSGVEDIIANGETITIGGTFYLKLDEFSSLSKYIAYETILDEIKGQWIKINMEDLQGYGSLEYKTMQEKSQKAQVEIVKRLANLLKEKKFYNIKEFSDQKIEGKKFYYYFVSLDKEKIKELTPEILRIYIEEMGKLLTESGYPFSEKDISTAVESGSKESSKKIDDFFAKTGELGIEMWVGKKDNLLYKIKFEKAIEISSATMNNIVFEMTLSDFNKLVKIEEPEKFIPLNEIIPLQFLIPSVSPF